MLFDRKHIFAMYIVYVINYMLTKRSCQRKKEQIRKIKDFH